MGASITTLPGLGDLDRAAYHEIPLGMESFKGKGLVLVAGVWRLVIGSPAWAFFFGRQTVAGWDAPGKAWNRAPGSDTNPAPPAYESRPKPGSGISAVDPVIEEPMANATNTQFALTPGAVQMDTVTGSLSTTGAGVSMSTTSNGNTIASVETQPWMDWIPWILLLGAVVMVLRRNKE